MRIKPNPITGENPAETWMGMKLRTKPPEAHTLDSNHNREDRISEDPTGGVVSVPVNERITSSEFVQVTSILNEFELLSQEKGTVMYSILTTLAEKKI